MAFLSSASPRTQSHPLPHRPLFQRFLAPFALLSSAVLSRTYLPFIVIGLVNRLTGRPIKSIFCFYVPNADYRSKYPLEGMEEFLRWQPTLFGWLTQGGKRGLVLGPAMRERDFLKRGNRAAFQRFCRRVQRIAWITGATEINLAGLLPSFLQRNGEDWFGDPRVAAAIALESSVLRLTEGARDVPIVLLGGLGFIGQALIARLTDAGYATHVIDKETDRAQVFKALGTQPYLVVDVSRQGVLGTIIDDLPAGTTLLNEVFPEPPLAVRQRLKARGITAWHLAGVEGKVSPSLPNGYASAVPCCAAHETDPDKLQPVLVAL